MRTIIKDESNDRKYFTVIPNYVANHSSANDQALYFQMKRLVGDKEGICYASEKYFKQKMKVGSKALKKSMKYLLNHEWIQDAGIKEVQTRGGAQKVRCYVVKDIWRTNTDYYEGVSEREPLRPKGVSESNQRGVRKLQRGSLSSNKEERKKNTKKNTLSERISINELFQAFWQAYPKKKAKPAALQAFRKLKPTAELLEVILKDILKKEKGRDWQQDNGRFIPYPATYINQQRWEDGEEPNKQSWQYK